MSVPPDRMAPRTPGTVKDPTKIMGVKKPVFYAIVVGGLILAFYIWRRSKNTPSQSDVAAGTQPSDTTNGVTAADIGGTPADNSFATNTDLTSIEEQIQSLQNSLFQLQQSNGGNGAGLPGGTKSPGGGLTGTPISFPFPGVTGGDPSGPPTKEPITGPIGTNPIHWFGPGGSGVWYPGITPSDPVQNQVTSVPTTPQSSSTVGPTGIPYSSYLTAQHAL